MHAGSVLEGTFPERTLSMLAVIPALEHWSHVVIFRLTWFLVGVIRLIGWIRGACFVLFGWRL